MTADPSAQDTTTTSRAPHDAPSSTPPTSTSPASTSPASTSPAPSGPTSAAPRREPFVLHVGRGLVMGGADIIPGVSGGTVALILGFYARLVAAIKVVATACVTLLRGRPRQAVEDLRTVEWSLVLGLGLGIVVAIGVGSAVLPQLIESYPVETSAAFFGMIVASLAVPWRVTAKGMRAVAIAAVFAILAFVVMGFGGEDGGGAGELGSLRVFASAAVAICAMILPGVSGAFLLVAIGAYEPTLDAIRQLDLAYIATFGAGAVIGLGLFSRLLSWLLEHRESDTMAALTGLMLGALRVLWPWGGTEGSLDAPVTAEIGIALALAAAGFLLVRGLLWFGDRSAPPVDDQVEDSVEA